jgi:hypothetical protein
LIYETKKDEKKDVTIVVTLPLAKIFLFGIDLQNNRIRHITFPANASFPTGEDCSYRSRREREGVVKAAGDIH